MQVFRLMGGVFLVQLPPTIPTMALCSLAAWWHHAKLIYDWHNFGYTLMTLSLGRGHWLVSGSVCAMRPLHGSPQSPMDILAAGFEMIDDA